MSNGDHDRQLRALAGALEPVAAQVYFAPECHAAYEQLGFGASRGVMGGAAMPDFVAYFCSRGSVMGQVAGDVIAAAFAVFNPAVVVPAVEQGWKITDASTIGNARTDGARAQLTRILGPAPDGLDRATELLRRATEPLRVEGRPLFAGMVAAGLPGDPIADMWRLADRLREYRGDGHTAAWLSLGLDAVEIGLLTELYWGLPLRTYIRSRSWSDADMDAAESRLEERGWLKEGSFTPEGRDGREEVERITDRSCRAVADALGDDIDELTAILQPWGQAIRQAGGYPGAGPHDMARRSG